MTTGRRKAHRRAATTGNIGDGSLDDCSLVIIVFSCSSQKRSQKLEPEIEIIAASQAKQVKIVVMGAESTGKTGKFLTLDHDTLNIRVLDGT